MSERDVEFDSARADCRQFDLELPAYLEGEPRPSVPRHASECAFCAAVLGDLELIRSRSSDVLLDDPPVRVWANVRAALAAEGFFREPRLRGEGGLKWLSSFGQINWMRYAVPFGAAACLVLVATVLWVSPVSINRNQAPQPSSEIAGPASNAPMAVDAGLVESVGAMEKTYREQEKFLDPTAKASYRKALKSLDDSIRECSDSVEKQPADAVAREYLNSAYEQKAGVLFTALEYDGR